MNAKRMLLIAYCIPPYAGSGVHRNLRIVRYLHERGWEIRVLTARQEDVKAKSPFDPELLAKLPNAVDVERTCVIRPVQQLVDLRNVLRPSRQQPTSYQPATSSPVAPAASPSVLQLGKDALSTLMTFPDAEIGWVPGAVWRGRQLLKAQGQHLLYTSGPPHSCHLVAWLLKRLSGCPWVADFRDPWTRRPWMDPRLKETWQHRGKVRLERGIVTAADRVVLNTEAARDEFASYYPTHEAEKFVAIPNGYDPDDFLDFPKPTTARDLYVVTHGGSLYRKRTPIGLLQAVAQLVREGQVRTDDIRIRFIGRSDLPAIQQDVASLGLTSCVEWVPPMPHRQCLEAMAASDLLLLIQPGTHLQVPAKLFEYIMLKKPILALAEEGATAAIIREHDLGEVVDATDIPGIKQAFLRLYQNHVQSQPLSEGYLRALETFHARSLTGRLDRLLSEVLLAYK